MPEFTDEQIRAGIDELRAHAEANNLTEAEFVKLVTDEAFKREIPLQRLADATVFDENDINQAIQRANAAGAGIVVPGDLALPDTGASLGGAESAITEALIQARKDVGTAGTAGVNAIKAGTQEATAQLQPFSETGRLANDKLAALNGLLGPEAQQAAMDEFTNSPGQAFLVEQANRNLLGNASAIGGLGGGNVRRELQRQAIGLAAQDFGNFINRLETTRAGGQNAAAGNAQLLGNAGRDQANVLTNTGRTLADLAVGAGSAIGSARLSTGQLLADQGFQSALQEAIFNQQNRNTGVAAIGGGGADLATIINNAARNSGNTNINTTQLMNDLTRLGVTSIPQLEGLASTATAQGNLAGANTAGDTAATIGSTLLGIV